MKTAHFFDIETILVVNSKVWIVDKKNPGFPVMKISESDFNLIKKGIYKSQGNNLKLNGINYFFPEDLFLELKLKCKKLNAEITGLAFSMQEYLSKEIIETLDYEINIENMLHVKNTNDDIYVICSKNNKSNYESIINKIEDKLKKNGLFIKKYYFISDTFYSRDLDAISHKKVRLLLQHLIGLKTEGDKFVDEHVEKYDATHFDEDDQNTVVLAQECNRLLRMLIDSADGGVKAHIKDVLEKNRPVLNVNYVSPNKVNKFNAAKVVLEYGGLIKTFENFANSLYTKYTKN